MSSARADELTHLLSKGNSEEKSNYLPRNRVIYYGSKAALPFVALNMIIAAGYGAKYATKGTNDLLKVMNITLPELSIAIGITSLVSTNFVNLAFSDWMNAPKDIDTWVGTILHSEEGAIQDWFAETFSSSSSFLEAVFRGSCHTLYSIAYLAGTYMGLEPVKEILESYLGQAGAFTLLALLGIGGLISYAHPYGPRCNENIPYYLKGIEDLLKGKPAFIKRFHNHRSLTIEIEVYLEGLTNPTSRVFLSSFSFIRLAEQWGLSPAILGPIGGASGATLALLIFTPKLIKEYHGHFDIPDAEGGPVTQEERNDIYQERYQTMSFRKIMLSEIRRFFFFGAAQSSLTLYYTINWLSPAVQSKLIEYGMKEDRANLISNYLLVGSTFAFCVYASSLTSLYKELNKAALEKRSKAAVESKNEVSACAETTASTMLFLSSATQIPTLFASVFKHMPRADAAAISLTIGSVNAESRYIAFKPAVTQHTDSICRHLSTSSMFKKEDSARPVYPRYSQQRTSFCDKVRAYFSS